MTIKLNREQCLAMAREADFPQHKYLNGTVGITDFDGNDITDELEAYTHKVQQATLDALRAQGSQQTMYYTGVGFVELYTIPETLE